MSSLPALGKSYFRWSTGRHDHRDHEGEETVHTDDRLLSKATQRPLLSDFGTAAILMPRPKPNAPINPEYMPPLESHATLCPFSLWT